MGTWWSEHPDLESLARRGRREYEDDVAAAEHDTELLRKRRRSLRDVCFEWMSRGDLVSIATAGNHFEGHLVAVVNDLAILRTRTIEIAVKLSTVDYVRSNRRAAFAGTSGERSVSSFRALLGRFEIEGTPVRLVGMDMTFDVTGTIDASTDDHILMRDAQNLEWVLPRVRIAYAIGIT